MNLKNVLSWSSRCALALLSIGSFAAVVSADTLSEVRDRGEFRIGHRESSFPLSFKDRDGQPAGYSVDICRRIFEAVKVEIKRPDLKLQFVPVTPANRALLLTEGKIDIECGSTTNTTERGKQVNFSYTTFMAGARLLTRANSGIKSLSDLRGKKVAVAAKTTIEDVLRKYDAGLAIGMAIVTAKDHAESFALLESGKVDALANDDVNLLGMIGNSANSKAFTFVGKHLSAEPLALMYRKDDPYFERVVDGAVAQLFYGHEIFPLYAKWFDSGALRIPMSLHMRENIRFPNKHAATF